MQKPKINIKPMGMFHTPKSMAELERYLNGLVGSERAVAIVTMGMTWNYLAAVVKEAQASPAKQDTSSQNPYANITGEEDD